MYKRIIYVICLLINYTALSQEVGIINSDRPDQSEGVYTLSKNILQIEDGFTFSDELIANNLMLRYGLMSGTEVRLSSDIEKQQTILNLDNITLSAKQQIIKGERFVPAITLVGYFSYTQNFKKIKTDVKLAFENEITQELTLAYNLGTSNGFKNLDFTAQIGFSPVEKWTFIGEYFSVFSKNNSPEHNFDINILYLINSNFQLDAALGTIQDNLFFSTGISYRIFL